MLETARRHADRLLKLDTRNLGWHGNALLVKPHVGVIDVAALDLPTLEPRGAVMAELIVGDRPFRVIGLHLDLSGLWRRRQMRAILDAVAMRPQKMPTVLMGDTNEWRTAAGCLKELNGCYRVAPTGPSFHSRRPIAPLDRIIVDERLAIEAAGVHASPCARRASDHLPVWARLVLPTD
jgi:endonuclease/exonuclease/phosphatase family metal-dependent hydrolase